MAYWQLGQQDDKKRWCSPKTLIRLHPSYVSKYCHVLCSFGGEEGWGIGVLLVWQKLEQKKKKKKRPPDISEMNDRFLLHWACLSEGQCTDFQVGKYSNYGPWRWGMQGDGNCNGIHSNQGNRIFQEPLPGVTRSLVQYIFIAYLTWAYRLENWQKNVNDNNPHICHIK